MAELRVVLKEFESWSKMDMQDHFLKAGFAFDWEFPGTSIFSIPAPGGDTWILPLPATVEKMSLINLNGGCTSADYEVVFSSRDGLLKYPLT
jgi:hypothetical protein